MKKSIRTNFKIMLGSIVFLMALLSFFTVVTPAYAQSETGLLDNIKGYLGDTNSEAQLPHAETGDLPEIIGRVIKNALVMLGTLFLGIIMVAGFTWMTAGGNPDRAKKAMTYIRNAVIGLLIIFLSYGITIFVFDVLLSATEAV